MRISVIGSGGWGTAISVLLADNGHEVTLWSFLKEEADALSRDREHKQFLPGVRLPDGVRISNDIACAGEAEFCVLATPSFAVEPTVRMMKDFIQPGTPVVCLTKGMDEKNGFCVFAETIAKILGDGNPVAALTGPSHAEEVGRGMATVVVAASPDPAVCRMVQDAFMCDRFRVYTTPDIVGAQLGAALKNVVALAAGICDGMGFGDNAKAALMTRGLTEMARLGVAMGGRRETFAGLSGLGDLIVTCTSMHSRNRRAGILIGKGKTADEAVKEIGAVVEGYYATKGGYMLARKMGVEMPICEALYKVLYENGKLDELVNSLMTRAKRPETEEYWIS